MKKFLLHRCIGFGICFLLFFSNAKAICNITPADTTVAIACGDSFVFGGIAYYLPVTQTDTFASIHGCDSIVTLHLNVVDTVYLSGKVCAGDSFLFNGAYLDTAGIYNAHFTAQTGCDSTVILTLAVRPAPVVTFTWDSLFALGDIWSYYSFDSNPADTFVWVHPCSPFIFALTGGNPPGGHYSGSGVVNDTFYAEQAMWQPSTYDTITYTFFDGNHCGQSASGILRIVECEGIHEIGAQYLLQLYPNPATDYLTVQYSGVANNSKIEVLDVLGRVVKTKPVSAGTGRAEVDTHLFSNGLYFIRVLDGGAAKQEAKFSVVR